MTGSGNTLKLQSLLASKRISSFVPVEEVGIYLFKINKKKI